ncbi:hypothetical protein HYO65_gp109 [Tenacibaculum phage PTm1]|uniref:Uncharacterized protein n=2 Tax=Shirahamavirus PTm1 TaxID=2846435 RepID=A0A5S9BZ11_9CAUD|nr:hypothetical protein HYO65_gp109 [Tenacibaculum phage PTm1]BBI90501.1 hypothetical protein [Tenacibaculum phage PTm1]BBI90809.1 hypothetical protein [Tenacibaculum phage PTm5]
MIRLSQVTAFEINNSEDFARDLDSQPKLYLYEQNVNTGRVDKLFIQDDSSTTSTKRKYSYAPFWRNTLLGTTNFFPEQSTMNVTNYHTNALLQTVLGKATLPNMEYKVCYLYFSRGFLADASIIGNAIRLFVRLSNGTEVTLASIADFKNDSLVSAVPNKLFENQIFAEALKFEIPDVDFILNSNNVDIVALRTRLFGTERPSKIHIEYSAFTNDTQDVYIDNSKNFTRLNFSAINQQTIDIGLSNEALFAKVEYGTDNSFLQSSIAHQKYLVELYLNTLKESGASYKVEHVYSINVYNSSNAVIETKQVVLRDPVNKFNTVQYRPVVSPTADHMNVELTVRIENEQTGVVIRRSTSMVVTSSNISKFKTASTFTLSNLSVDSVTNKTTKEVKQIVQSSEVPNFVQLTKNVYVQVQSTSDNLNLLNAEFTAKINVTLNVTAQSRTFLKIDNLVIQNEGSDLTTYKIPAIAYQTKSTSYLILDANGNVITQGKLTKTI